MPPRATRLKDLLNSPLATAYTRAFVLVSPFAATALTFAAMHWINEKIAQAPSVVTLTIESADTTRRVIELEIKEKLSLQKAERETKDVSEMKDDVKKILATVNKMAGAMEVRTGMRLTEESLNEGTVLARQP